MSEIEKTRRSIASGVRALREARGWTQARLAEHLAFSQARLSEVERGGGSFTAEQLVEILRLFNVGLSELVPDLRPAPEAALQNAVARLGGVELQEQVLLPSEQVEAVGDVVREVIVGGESRLLVALAPVLIQHIERIKLESVYRDLHRFGFERRLGWLVENVLSASRAEAETAPREWRRRYLRAVLLLERFLEWVRETYGTKLTAPLDPLDSRIRSQKTLTAVSLNAAPIAKEWRIATSLDVSDFRDALQAAYVAG